MDSILGGQGFVSQLNMWYQQIRCYFVGLWALNDFGLRDFSIFLYILFVLNSVFFFFCVSFFNRAGLFLDKLFYSIFLVFGVALNFVSFLAMLQFLFVLTSWAGSPRPLCTEVKLLTHQCVSHPRHCWSGFLSSW